MNKTVRNILALALILVLLYFGRDYVDTGPSVGPATLPAITQEVPAGGSVGNYFTVYFTNPPLNGDVPGIESNLITLIGNAKKSVHGAFFELDLSDVTEAFVEAKHRGVDVKLVYDSDQMTDTDRRDILKKLKSAGIPVIPDERSAFMHDKFAVIDDQLVWTGSFNLTNNAAHRNNENAVVFVVPQLVANYEREFSELFSGKFGPKSPSDTPYPVVVVNGNEIDNYFAPEDDVMPKVIAAVKGAKDSIDFLSFSFTDNDLAYTMSELALNDDISVRGVFETSQSSGSVCQYLIGRAKNIEGNGKIEVKLDGNPGTMHEKVIVIDDKIVIFGSFNFSGQANTSNDENLLIVHDPQFAGLFESEFLKVFNKGITPTDACKKP